MNIFILGAGYLGLYTASLLKDKGHIVTATTTDELKLDRMKDSCTHAVLCDYRDAALYLRGSDVVVVTIAPENRIDYLRCAEKMVEFCKDGERIKQLIYTSTTGVYGDRGGGVVDEESKIVPASEKERIFFETEKTYQTLEPEKIVTILRLGGIYGPGRELRPYPFLSGEKYCNLVHLDDAARAIVFSIDNQLSGIYNICDKKHPKRKELFPGVSFDENRAISHSDDKRVSNKKITALRFVWNHSL